MYEQSALPDGVSVTLSGWSLLFGAGSRLQELLNPKAEWSGVAVSLPHWIEMTPLDGGMLGTGREPGKRVNMIDVANGVERGRP